MGRVGALGLVLFLAGAARGQEAYSIRLKEAAQGDRRLCDVTSSTQITTRLVNPSGEVLQDKTLKSAQQSVFRETVLEKAAGQKLPARLRREYDKAVVWVEGKPQVLPHQGKAVLIENKKGRCSFRLEGGTAMTGLAASLLSREMKKGDLRALLLPPGAVQPGAAWKIDMKPLTRVWEQAIGMQLDAARAAGTGRLVRVYRKDSRLYGVMAFHLEAPITTVGAGSLAAEAGSKLVTDVSLDCCIDGSASSGTLQASFQVSAAARAPGPEGAPARLVVSTRGALREVRTELPERDRARR
jgi:hypothetical protein